MKTLQYAGFTVPEFYADIKDIAKKHPEKVLPMKERFLRDFAEKVYAPSPEKVWRIIEDATPMIQCILHRLYGAGFAL